MTPAILVVGAAGFIGSQLVPALQGSGRRVVTVDCRERFPLDTDLSQIKSLERLREAFDQVDDVIWLASTTTPGSSVEDPDWELTHNLYPFIEMLKLLRSSKNCRILFVSTGGAIYGNVSEGMATESHAIDTTSYYAAAKASSEHFLTAFCLQFRKTAVILRPSNVYGQGQRFKTGFGIVPSAFRSLLSGELLSIWGDGELVRDYLEIRDMVSLCVAILEEKNITAGQPRIFNASSAQGITTNKLLSMIEDISGMHIPRRYVERRSSHVSKIVLDNSKARKAFSWQPTIPLEQGLADAWQWFKSQPS